MIDIFVKSTPYLAVLLTICFGLSLLGSMHWCFALLAQFKLQFFFGALILLPFTLWGGAYIWSIILFGVAGFSYVQTRLPMADPFAFQAQAHVEGAPDFQVVQYNKLYRNKDYDALKAWLNSKAGRGSDLLIMQEVEEEELVDLSAAVKDILPYGLPAGTGRPDMIAVFSKYPLEHIEKEEISRPVCGTMGMRFDLQPEFMDSPVRIYTVHTRIPLGQVDYACHSAELAGMAHWIAKDESAHILFMGDWNTTAYSPIFARMMDISGLHYQRFGLVTAGTWPHWGILPMFKIPIDHILYNDGFRIRDIKKGASFGSDHHSLVARFSLAP